MEEDRIIKVNIETEMKTAYIDYSMSVIVSRALPDVRDGLKPVHRRVLFGMNEMGNTSDKPHKKSANCVGDVMAKYHPHGDSSIYGTVVRLAQPWAMRYCLVDGHGNFGSVDGDPPAAYRYTEARMSKLCNEMLRDIDKDTVAWDPNFDESRKEPRVLPSRFPNLLVNGSSGIAVGMATNIPPHNLTEVINACVCILENPEAELADLMEYIKGPDFPTRGIIMGRSGIRAAYATGRGKITLRGRAEIVEKKNGRYEILISEIPYMVNKTRLIESIADLVKDKRIEGISDLNDESSSRTGMKIVIEIKKDANPQVVLNQLYRFTQLQDTVGVIMLALDGGVLLCDDAGLCEMDMQTGQTQVSASARELGIRLEAEQLQELPEGYLLYTPNGQGLTFLRWEDGSVPEKTVLQLAVVTGGGEVSYDFRQMVQEFNTGQDRYRIEYETYYDSEYDTDAASLDVLRTQIMAGQGPDLFAFYDINGFNPPALRA